MVFIQHRFTFAEWASRRVKAVASKLLYQKRPGGESSFDNDGASRFVLCDECEKRGAITIVSDVEEDRERDASVERSEETTRIPTRYYVDHENSGSLRLDGLEYLGKEDVIFLVYTDNANSLSLDLFQRLKERSVFVHKAPIGEQSADKHLIALLALDVGVYGKACRYVVLSGDNGYLSNIGLLKRLTGVDAELCESIRASLCCSSASGSAKPRPAEPQQPSVTKPDRQNSFIRLREFIRDKINVLTVDKRLAVANAFEDGYRVNQHKDCPPHLKTLVYNALTRVLGDSKGREIYQLYKDQFDYNIGSQSL